MSVIDGLRARIATTSLPQAARLIELARRGRRRADGSMAEIGADTPPPEEPLRFIASDRMALPSGDLAGIEMDDDGTVQSPVRIIANILGLAGTTPALPPVYSETQIQRRRLRDRSFASFLNIFDHRALSFFYRIFRKYHWLVGYERAGGGGDDAVTGALLAIAGLGTPASRRRLPFDDGLLVPLAAHLGDMRRSAASLQTALRHVTGLRLRVVEAEATWMALPATEQTRLGAPGGLSRLGGADPASGLGLPDAALIGAAVLDVQHHFAVEIGPLGYGELLDFCAGGDALRIVEAVCQLAAGIEHRPVVRLVIAAGDVPALRLGARDTPAFLGRTTWLGAAGPAGRLLTDCAIPIGAPLAAA